MMVTVLMAIIQQDFVRKFDEPGLSNGVEREQPMAHEREVLTHPESSDTIRNT